MRFRVRVEVWFEVSSLERAQELATEADAAMVDAVGPAIVRAPGREWSRTELEPGDDDALAALAADDLGPAISFARFGPHVDPDGHDDRPE